MTRFKKIVGLYQKQTDRESQKDINNYLGDDPDLLSEYGENSESELDSKIQLFILCIILKLKPGCVSYQQFWGNQRVYANNCIKF